LCAGIARTCVKRSQIVGCTGAIGGGDPPLLAWQSDGEANPIGTLANKHYFASDGPCLMIRKRPGTSTATGLNVVVSRRRRRCGARFKPLALTKKRSSRSILRDSAIIVTTWTILRGNCPKIMPRKFRHAASKTTGMSEERRDQKVSVSHRSSTPHGLSLWSMSLDRTLASSLSGRSRRER
jgi:hypothetical protein